jgi:DNA primase
VLIGYAGRVVDDAAINENNPRYRFPGGRRQNGKNVEFRKSLFLYNGHRIQSPVDDLIVVEGFASVWWLAQHGFPATVATMGADCSAAQANLIVSCVHPCGRIWISPDGDRAGERHAQLLLTLLSPHRSVRWIKLADGQQPTNLSAADIKTLYAF